MLISEPYTEAKVALGIGSLKFKRNALLLASRKQHVSIEHHIIAHSSHLTHVDIYITQYAKPPESLVGTVDLRCVIAASGLHVASIVKHLRTQITVLAIKHRNVAVTHRIESMEVIVAIVLPRIVVGHEYYIAYGVYLVQSRGVSVTARQMRPPEIHCEINVTRSSKSVGSERYVLLVEGVITLVAQQFGDSYALLVKLIAVKEVTGLNSKRKSVAHHNPGYRRIGQIVVDCGYIMRLSSGYVIGDIDFLLVVTTNRVDFHNCAHVTAIDQSLSQLIGRCLGKCLIIYHGRLSELAHPAVKPLGGVAA